MAKQKSVQEIELENRVMIDDYFNKYIVGLKKGLKPINDLNNTSICPFHTENDPSWHYWVQKKRYHCFGCGATGNIVRLHQQVQAFYHHNIIDTETAINELIAMYGLKTIIKEVEAKAEAEVPLSAFDKARKQLLDGLQMQIPADTITISKFRALNTRVKNMDIPQQQKFEEYRNLDMMAGLIIAQEVEN